MNKLIVIITLAILSLLGLSFKLQSGNLSKDHNECFSYQNAQMCAQMGCNWDGLMCHPDSLLLKHTCPVTHNTEECVHAGCQMQGGICVDVE